MADMQISALIRVARTGADTGGAEVSAPSAGLELISAARACRRARVARPIPVTLAAPTAVGDLRVGRKGTLTVPPGCPVRGDFGLVPGAADVARQSFRPPLSRTEARVMLGVQPRGLVPTQTGASA